jgi:hypothetical protein
MGIAKPSLDTESMLEKEAEMGEDVRRKKGRYAVNGLDSSIYTHLFLLINGITGYHYLMRVCPCTL